MKKTLNFARKLSRAFAFFKRKSPAAFGEKDEELPLELRGRVFEASSTEADDDVLSVAKKVFGVSRLYPWQRLVIGNILDAAADNLAQNDGAVFGADKNLCSDVFCMGRQIVLLPTGAGKSMCFLLPAVMLSGPTLIFYPLLALMADFIFVKKLP